MRKQSELPKVAKTPNDMDKLRKFLELDRKVLRFYCIWDDRDQMFGEVRRFILHVSRCSCRRGLLFFVVRLIFSFSNNDTDVTVLFSWTLLLHFDWFTIDLVCNFLFRTQRPLLLSVSVCVKTLST